MYTVLMTLFNHYFRNPVMPFKWKRLIRILIEHSLWLTSEKEEIKEKRRKYSIT